MVKSKTIYNYLFYISYFLIVCYSYLGQIDMFKNPLSIISKVSLLLLFLSFILQIKKYSKNEIIISSFLIICSFANIFFAKDFTFFKIILIILCLKDVDLNKLIKYDFIFRIIILFIIFSSLNLGFCKDELFYDVDIVKHSLGFRNPNILGMYSFLMCLEFIYLNWKKMNILKYSIMFIFILVLNKYIMCKTSLIMFFLSVIIKILFDFNKKIFDYKFVKKIICNSYVIFFVLTIIFWSLYYFNFPIGNSINQILSNRLFNISYHFFNSKVSLFGSTLDDILTLDSFYIYSLLSFGIINFIILFILIKKMFNESFASNDRSLIYVFLLLAFYGFSERLLFSADYNAFICFLSLALFKKIKRGEEND